MYSSSFIMLIFKCFSLIVESEVILIVYPSVDKMYTDRYSTIWLIKVGFFNRVDDLLTQIFKTKYINF